MRRHRWEIDGRAEGQERVNNDEVVPTGHGEAKDSEE
jgi:hypothetical protein